MQENYNNDIYQHLKCGLNIWFLTEAEIFVLAVRAWNLVAVALGRVWPTFSQPKIEMSNQSIQLFDKTWGHMHEWTIKMQIHSIQSMTTLIIHKQRTHKATTNLVDNFHKTE